MDSKRNGFVGHCVLILVLLKIQWRPAFPAPVYTNCEDNLTNTKRLAELLKHEAKELLNMYTQFHGSSDGPAPAEVPESTISGTRFTEKLQDMYKKSELYALHILKVREYQKELWEDDQPLEQHLTNVEKRLSSFSAEIKSLVTNLDQGVDLPGKPDPPKLPYDHDFEKKTYGWHVIDRLGAWLSHVVRVLEQEKTCGYKTHRRRRLSKTLLKNLA